MVDTWRWRDMALDKWRQLVEAVVGVTDMISRTS
jgi:hypothetical protein